MPTPPRMIGTSISHYRITAKLGEGGMGAVYEAEDIKLQRQVALKFLPPDLAADRFARERLLREAQAASRLEHGFAHKEWIQHDADLNALRSNPRFQALLSRL